MPTKLHYWLNRMLQWTGYCVVERDDVAQLVAMRIALTQLLYQKLEPGEAVLMNEEGEAEIVMRH
jgi:hypothetical protein